MSLSLYREEYDRVYLETLNEAEKYRVTIELPPPSVQMKTSFGIEVRSVNDFAKIANSDWPFMRLMKGTMDATETESYCHFLWRQVAIGSTNNCGQSEEETHYLYPCLGPLGSLDLSRITPFRFPGSSEFMELWNNRLFSHLREAQHTSKVCEVCDLCRNKDTRDPQEFEKLEYLTKNFVKAFEKNNLAINNEVPTKEIIELEKVTAETNGTGNKVWQPTRLASKQEVNKIIVGVEKYFSKRIRSINTRKNQVVIELDNISDEDEDFVENLVSIDAGPYIPVILMDTGNKKQLKQLSCNERVDSKAEQIPTNTCSTELNEQNPWHRIASDKLHTANALDKQKMSGVMDLISASVCTKISALCGRYEQISQDNACLELCTNVHLMTKLTKEEIGTFSKVFNLQRLNAVLPSSVIKVLIDDLQSIMMKS